MTFKSGQSGNPKGRPKAPLREVKELAREHTEEAVRRLAYWMRQTKVPSAAIAAALALLDRGWGKATSISEVNKSETVTIDTTKVSDVEAARLIAFALARGVAAPKPENAPTASSGQSGVILQ